MAGVILVVSVVLIFADIVAPDLDQLNRPLSGPTTAHEPRMDP